MLEALAAVERGVPAHELETSSLDFKAEARSRGDFLKLLAEASACFANACGGQVVIGVPDGARSVHDVTGTDLEAAVVQRRIFELTVPPLVVAVEAVMWQGRRLVCLMVPQSPDVHQVDGRAKERVGAACEVMSAARISSVLSDRRGFDWSSLDCGMSANAISDGAAQAARQYLSRTDDVERRSWATLPMGDLLSRLGLVNPSGSLNNAARVLLIDGGGHAVDYVFRSGLSGELVTNERLAKPVLLALATCLEAVELRTDRTPVNLPGGQQVLLAQLPPGAVREGLVNAVMHRDYQRSGSVQVEQAPGFLSITSPGSFVSGVTAENVLTVSSRPRNPALAGAIRKLGLGETAGVGVDRMYAEMARLGLEPPGFDDSTGSVCVTLVGGAPNVAFVRFVAGLPEQHRSDPDTLLILLRLLTRKTVNAAGMARLLQKEPNAVEEVLARCDTELGLLERTRESARAAFGTYRLRAKPLSELGAAVTYRARAGHDTDEKVVALVREAGRINSRMLRTLLDVDIPTASRILGDLVARGVLQRDSVAKRGPGVTYAAGPAFPAKSSRRRSRRVPEPAVIPIGHDEPGREEP
ncbi:MAG: ATP-binding protein [Candidatus Nanopelagicales bacterium]